MVRTEPGAFPPRNLSLCSAFELRHQRTSLWVVLRDVRLGQVVNDLLLYNFGVIDEEFGAFVQQIFSNVDTRRLPGVAKQRHTLLSAPYRCHSSAQRVDRWDKRNPVSAKRTLHAWREQ